MTDDIRDTFIERIVSGRSFVDVGGLWGTVNEKVSVADAAGASATTMLDMQPPDVELWDDFRDRLRELDVDEYGCVSANIDDVGTPEQVGSFDVVHCSGVLYHAPNPVHTLTQLRRICTEHLILTSVVVPERMETSDGAIELESGELLFIPHLPPERHAILRNYFELAGIPGSIGVQSPVERWEVSNYGAWWWIFTRPVLRQLASATSFEVIDEGDAWDGRAHCLLLAAR
jgi:SAM-dependent methyltransferase